MRNQEKNILIVCFNYSNLVVQNLITPFDSSIFEIFFYIFDKNRLFCLIMWGTDVGDYGVSR